jgi:hypothetical protein
MGFMETNIDIITHLIEIHALLPPAEAAALAARRCCCHTPGAQNCLAPIITLLCQQPG